ncbi:NB-ARC domain-containing protein [Streptomyces sp. NPDC085540]|uniref:NB-ARC domain-containing protein n=1 Tax=Streptomyces sp. NPDC085540 TaxID=3365730 RepID=UPI0037D51327
MLAQGGTAVLGQGGDGAGTAGVLAGLGGVGKSQLAAAYSRRLMADGNLDVLVWVSAATRAAVIAAYDAAAKQLLGSAAPNDPNQAAAALVAWLEPMAGRPVCRWLVVLDDVADPDHLTGLWPPHSPTGRILVTSRRQDPAMLNGRHLVTVGVFTPVMSRAYLTGALVPYRLATPLEDLDTLAADLGHLPLALAQAATYVAELVTAGMTVASYRLLLADRTTALRDHAPERLPDGQALTVAATWSLSIDYANSLRPVGLARPMLHLAAMLDPNGIPTDVLTSAPARRYLARHRTRPDNTPAPPAKHHKLSAQLPHRTVAATDTPIPEEDALAALSALHRLSLITHTLGTFTAEVRVHQLVQRATLDTLSPDQQQPLAHTARDALLAVWPATPPFDTSLKALRDTALEGDLRANTTALKQAVGGRFPLPEIRPRTYWDLLRDRPYILPCALPPPPW